VTFGRILVVDDARVNRRILVRALETQGHSAAEAADGLEALSLLATAEGSPFDVVLLDLEMPLLDGYETLARIKADDTLRHIPVIVISAVDQLDSVVRCIEMGATDYLPKPFNAAILQARISSSLAGKRLRDLELEYLEQVGRVTAASVALETEAFDPTALDSVGARGDALGQLARTFQRMAIEIKAREDRLRAEVRELRIEIDTERQARKVAEITETDFFRDLRERASDLRRTVSEPVGDDRSA
jgi:CheY-like chemotaxis protein